MWDSDSYTTRTFALTSFPPKKLRHTKGGVFVMSNMVDMVGLKFGKLTVIKRYEVNSNNHKARWVCLCECGNLTIVEGTNLRRNHAKSCGCAKSEMCRESAITHGMRYTRQYAIWKSMLRRCYTPSDHNYKYYGARGIKACEEWNSFEKFWEDMNSTYSDELSIDRIDVNGNYCKENCRWITHKEQCNNKRDNAVVTYKGVTDTLTNICIINGKDYRTVLNRIRKGNWTIERAMETKSNKDAS